MTGRITVGRLRLMAMCLDQGGIVTALKPKPSRVTATCFQYHVYGRRTGLKIRSGNTRVVSSPTFDTEMTSRIPKSMLWITSYHLVKSVFLALGRSDRRSR